MQAVTEPAIRFDNVATGRVVKTAREAAGKTQKEVAEKMGISAMFLCDLEFGRRNWTEARFEAAKLAIEGDGKAVAA